MTQKHGLETTRKSKQRKPARPRACVFGQYHVSPVSPTPTARADLSTAQHVQGIAPTPTKLLMAANGNWDSAVKIEKVYGAIEVAEYHGGCTWSLNLGEERIKELMALAANGNSKGDTPTRRMSKLLNRHLKKQLGYVPPYVFGFEFSPEGRLHLHGAVILREALEAAKKRVHKALSAAGGKIDGRSGSTQSHSTEITYGIGWGKYTTKTRRQTQRLLGTDDVTFVNRELQQMTRTAWEDGLEATRPSAFMTITTPVVQETPLSDEERRAILDELMEPFPVDHSAGAPVGETTPLSQDERDAFLDQLEDLTPTTTTTPATPTPSSAVARQSLPERLAALRARVKALYAVRQRPDVPARSGPSISTLTRSPTFSSRISLHHLPALSTGPPGARQEHDHDHVHYQHIRNMTMTTQYPTQERLHELLDFDGFETFWWKVDRRGKAKAGDVAGTVINGRYRVIGIDGRIYSANKLADIWLGEDEEAQSLENPLLKGRPPLPASDPLFSARQATLQDLLELGGV